MERLLQCHVTPILLDTQYRMHPGIAAFPSKQFYSSKLRSFPTPADRPAPLGIPWPDGEIPILFEHCVDGVEESSGDGTSLYNKREAARVIFHLKNVLSKASLAAGIADVGVITPYSGQVRLLRDMIEVESSLGLRDMSEVEIQTVDGFQGREKELIIVSTVRANPSQRLGFLIDARRMNVAITRARRGLLVIGSLGTLKHDSTWRAWLAHLGL